MRLLIFAFLLLSINAFAQKITLSAKLQDRLTGEPLPFASVGLKAKSISTVSNLQGEFDFHMPSEFRNEILVISMLGYERFEAPVWSFIDKPDQIILMDKSSTLLSEVVVFDSLTGGEIFRNAWERIPTNFPMKPFLMDGFYRDVKKVGGSYISLLEAAVKIYDDDYKEPRNKSRLRERVKLIEVRKSLGYENKFTQYFGQQNLLEDLLLHNNIRYRQIDAKDEFFELMKREPDSYYNGHEVFVISNDTDFHLKVFVDKEDYAIIRLDFEIKTPGENLARRKGLVSKFIGYKKTIDFKRYLGKMYLNHITVTSTERWYDEKTNDLKFETELIQHLLINEVYAFPPERIGPTEKMKNYGLQYQDYPYDKTFWDNYNVIKETPLDRKILQDLERQSPLEKQFED
ncbi:MAG TPA: carboxypeptidase-like regulatory domain-containing protein [Chryseolinea sp.]|nr:carboxypeptidase-like regulatory domain-containing protein [Chryseolinea sp.]HPM29854.1 carboxypeptidase-like regulatory domain-containing protein [Chryseolinea sp.]